MVLPGEDDGNRRARLPAVVNGVWREPTAG